MIQNYLKGGGLWKSKSRLKSAMNLLVLGAILMASIVPAYSQERTVSGKVTDSNGDGLIGVNILVKGTLNGAVTDIDGNYSISASSDAVLVFTYIGFGTKEVSVGAQTTIDIIMEEDYGELDEVVVIGYGTTKKSDLTGSVVAIDEKNFNKGQINSPQELLTGRIAGVNVTSSDGAPGAGSVIRIRGGSSLSASNDPLIVIDGVPVSSEEVGGTRNALGTINPNDIESVTVLKDASATAIYGARASNGVILVTTKRGDSGQIKIGYSSKYSVSVLPQTVDVLTASEYTQLINDNVAAGNLSSATLPLLGTTNTDWQDAIYSRAFGTDQNINASGNFKGVPFRVSAGYTNQDGILDRTSFERSSVALAVDPSFLNDRLQVQINVKASRTNNEFGDTGAIGAANTFDPTQPVFDSESPWGGYFFYRQSNDPNASNFNVPDALAPRNPRALLDQTNDRSTTDRIIANASIRYEIPAVEGLYANLNIGIDRTTVDGRKVIDSLAQSARSQVQVNNVSTIVFGRDNPFENEYRNDLVEFYLNYTKELPSINSSIEVIGGYSYQDFFREEASSETDINGLFEFAEFDAATSENRLISFYGRLKYDFMSKYLLTVTVRRDGSSRFVGDNQWGVFPSAALAWRIKDESFLSGVDFLSDLKVRAGYGVTAQENISDNFYPALSTITTSQSDAQYQIGVDTNGDPIFITLARFGAFDPNLKWEETTTINAGIDYSFWNGRISGSFDWYRRETTDLINEVDVTPGTNFSNRIFTNVGTLENNGVEFSINGVVVDNADWRVDLGWNATVNNNEVTRLTNVDIEGFLGNPVGGISGGTGNRAQINSTGFNRSTFWLYEQVYDNNGNPIEGVYVDVNGDGAYTDADRIRFRNPDPDIFMGFNSFVAYKNLSLNMNGRWQIGNYVYNNVASANGNIINAFSNNSLRNLNAVVLETGFIGNVPTDPSTNLLSNYYLEDASFFRMDNITVAYSFDKFFRDDLRANLSFTVQNAFVITNYSGLDPEVEGGIDDNLFPRPRVFTVGLNVNFR